MSKVKRITCEICGKLRVPISVKNRNICATCYENEPSQQCNRCGRIRHLISVETGVCPECTHLLATSTELLPCEICGKLRIPTRHRTNQLKNRNICATCYKNEPSQRCNRCGRMKHNVSVETGICSQCSHILSRPTGIHQYQRGEHSRVECSVCGKLRLSALANRHVCESCHKAELHGLQTCMGCKRKKLLHSLTNQLCRNCYQNFRAATRLEKYVSNYKSPYPSNELFFRLLVDNKNWKPITAPKERIIRYFGKYLQTVTISSPLTWETIDQITQEIHDFPRTKRAGIRVCLLALADILVSAGQLESLEEYQTRKIGLSYIENAPDSIRPLLHKYAEWLKLRNIILLTINDHLYTLSIFWNWCQTYQITSPASVSIRLINCYISTLTWLWHCSACNADILLDLNMYTEPKNCPACKQKSTLIKQERYRRNTLRIVVAHLRMFFEWCRLNKLAFINPIQVRITKPQETITHYPLEIIKELCEYIKDPASEPLAALVIYLIVFHATSIAELRRAKLPDMFKFKQKLEISVLCETFYVIIPHRKPSRGVQKPRRPTSVIKFPEAAAAYLKPLLERYEAYRSTVVTNPRNRFLLATAVSGRKNVPISAGHINDLVGNASKQIADIRCNPNTLKKTAGIMFADHAGPGILRYMGWNAQQAFAYNWAERIVIGRNNSVKLLSDNKSEDIEFPAPGHRTDLENQS